MAERYAVADGNWSNVATWDGGASVPTTGDTVHAGGFNVTVNQSITVTELTTEAGASAPAAGSFVLTDGVVVTADITSGTSTCLTGSGTISADIVGNVAGSDSTNGGVGLAWSSSGSLTVTGNLSPGQAGRSAIYGLDLQDGDATITGDVTSSTTAGGSGPGTRHGARVTNAAALTVVGNVTGGGSNNHGIEAITSGAITVTGNVTGGSTVGSYGIESVGTGSVTITGDLTSDSGAAVFVTQATLIHSGNLIADATGVHPLAMDDTAYLIHATAEMSHQLRVDSSGSPGVARSLYTGGTDIGNPSESDVRSGTTFGPSSEYTGSLAVPAAQYVSQGVLVDATVGTLTGAGTLAAGTAQGGTSTTIQLAASETFGDDILNGNIVKLTDGTGAGQSRRITDYVGATDTATVHEAWTTTPDNTSTYEVVEGSHVTGISAAEVNAEVVDVVNVDTLVAGVTVAEALRRIGAVCAGEISGAGTGTETVTPWDAGAETVVFTVDSSGNRTAVAFN